MTAAELIEQLAETLGDRLPPSWREAYRAAPRHLFIPDKATRHPDGARHGTPIDRTTDPDGWLTAIYSPDIIVTQHDDNGAPTSSCSMPDMVFGMLDLLDPQPGHRALEIGTGTGWTAALLCHRLGEDNVTSIEVDPAVARHAHKALANAGFHPHLVLGDGAAGWPGQAPYDRIIATCTVGQIPYAWVAQSRPGGVIVSPVGMPMDPGGIVRLVVDEHGRAEGRYAFGSSFMWMRGTKFHAPDEPLDFDQRAEASTPEVEPTVLEDEGPMLALGHLIPRCRVVYDYAEDGSIDTWWLLAADSWAAAQPGRVRQLGPRRLWDEVEAAYRWWQATGEPGYDRFGITVTRERQWAWLDEPGNPVSSGDPVE